MIDGLNDLTFDVQGIRKEIKNATDRLNELEGRLSEVESQLGKIWRAMFKLPVCVKSEVRNLLVYFSCAVLGVSILFGICYYFINERVSDLEKKHQDLSNITNGKCFQRFSFFYFSSF